MTRKSKTGGETVLRGWQQIASFLGQPVTVAQRWAKSGMPVGRDGRFVVAERDSLTRWLGREEHLTTPARIPSAETDLVADLRQSLKTSRKRK